MSLPRITFLVSQLGFGGAEKQTFELARALARGGRYSVRCVCLSEMTEPYAPLLRDAGIEVTVIPRRSSFDFGRLSRLRRAVGPETADLVHCVHYLASGYGFLALLGRRRPVFLPSVRSTVIRPGRIKSAVYRRMLRSGGAVIVNSHRGAEFMQQAFGVEANRVRLIENGVDLDRLVERARVLPSAREELGLDDGVPLVGFVGKDSRVKNVGRFVEVCRRLESEMPRARFVLVGWRLGEEDRPRLGLSERYFLLGTRNDVPRLLRSMDALVMTSDSEGCPNVLIEAAALGVPAIAPDVGDCARVLSPVRQRSITASQDPDAYVERIRDVLERGFDDGERRRLMNWVTERYSLRAMIERTSAVYDELLAG